MTRTITPADVDFDSETVTRFMSTSSVPIVDLEPEDTVDYIAAPADEPEPDLSDVHDDEHRHVDYEVDQAKLDQAGADPLPWAMEFARFVGTTTGQWIDAETISNWFNAYGARVQQHTFRQSAFVVANTTLPASVQGDPAFLLLTLRDDLTGTFKKKAGQ